MPKAAGARRALIRVPRDHLVYQVEGLWAGVRYRILQTFQNHVSARLIHASGQIYHTYPIGNVVARFPRVRHASY